MKVKITLALAFLAGAFAALPAESATKSIALSGTGSPQTGAYAPSGDNDATGAEFFGQLDEEDGSPGPYPGIIAKRSPSQGTGQGVSVNSGTKAKSAPQFNIGSQRLKLDQQRSARAGTQVTVHPPDQP